MVVKNKNTTVEGNLRDLYELQLIDTKLDKIRNIRGELPMEVNDLEDEIAGLETRINNLSSEVEVRQKSVKEQKNAIKEAQSLMTKYETQQNNVKNNREYLALSKEIEMQKLEIMASEKKIKDYTNELKEKNNKKEETEKLLKERNSELADKKSELDDIIAETEKEEQNYQKLREQKINELEERLAKGYHRIRKSFKNGLAVVTIERDACGGCFSAIPPQRQLDIRQRKKIIICENCGRVLVDHDLANDIKEKSGIETS